MNVQRGRCTIGMRWSTMWSEQIKQGVGFLTLIVSSQIALQALPDARDSLSSFSILKFLE